MEENIRLTIQAADTSSHEELPLVGSTIKAGFPSPADDFLEQPLDLNRALIHNPAATFFVRVEGDSMAGAGIDDGDLLIVDRSVEPAEGSIAICFVDGEFTVKRLGREGGAWILLPSNSKYRPIRVAEGDELMIWGVVTFVVKAMR
ncbi:MAG: translesion error-prone DNA polymerase V autoproteolytic subunit [Rikenellaceae bacterium]|nr:translesion error-prone DNA polymerase V autoproteolytic subunit [Rikenellaceae bacterium]